MSKTHFSGLSVGDDGIEMTGSGTLRIPSIATAPSSPAVGDMYYNSTTGKTMAYQDSGWTSVDGSAAASLDAAYNGGATVAVDGGAVTLTDTQTTTGGGLLITKSGKVTSTHAASVFHINSTGAHDTSGALKMIEISVGTEAASGGVYGIEVGMYAHEDYALTATKGSVVITDGDFSVSGCGVSTTTGFIVTTANTSGDGVEFDLDSVTSGDAFIINCTTDATKYLSIQTDDTAIWSITGTALLQTVPIEINSGAAAAFNIEEADGTTTVFLVDASAGAGDTTVTMTGAAETLTGKVLNVTGSINTGNVVEINADAVSTGNALCISVKSDVMGATGAAISVIDNANSDREVFAVRDDGSVYMYGTAEGTTATQTVTGDMVITDGDLTVSGGEVAFTSDSTTAGLVMVNNTITTANSFVDISSTSITSGALMRLGANCVTHSGEVLELISLTPAAGTATGMSVTMASVTTGAATGISVVMAEATTTAKGISVTMDKVTAGDMLYLDAGGSTLNGGFYINCNDDNVSDFTVGNYGATTILGNAGGTDALTITAGDLLLDDSDENIIESENGILNLLLLDNKAGAVGSGKAVLAVDAGGVVNAGGYGILASFTGSAAAGSTVVGIVPVAGSIGFKILGSTIAAAAAVIDADPTAASVVSINGGGALTSDLAVLKVSSDGALATGSNTFRVDTTGAPASGAIYAEFDYAGVTDTNENVGVLIDATSKKVQALKILAAPLAGSAVLVSTTGALAADKATIEAVSTVASCNADSAVVRVDQASTTGVAFCMTLRQADVDQPFIDFECTSATGNSVDTHNDTEGTLTGFLRIGVNGTDGYISFYTQPTVAE